MVSSAEVTSARRQLTHVERLGLGTCKVCHDLRNDPEHERRKHACNTNHATSKVQHAPRATRHAPCKVRRKTCRATCEIAHPWQGAGEECLLPAPSTAGHAGWPCRGGTRQGRPQEIQRATRGLSRTTTRQSPAGAVWSTITQTRKHANTQTRKHARTHAPMHAFVH